MVCQNKTNKTVLKENLVVSSMLGVTVLSGALLTLPSALADDVVDTITITVPTSCSMSSTIATGDEHTAEINNGQYDSSIGETTIKAFCNDNEGFAIYAIGYTDNELGKNVLTNSTLGSTHDIVTGTAITGNTSQWAMKLSTITSPTPAYSIIIAGSTVDTLKQQNDPDFSNFTEVPDDYKKVAYRTASTDINPVGQQTAEGSTLKTTYQAYISPTQVAGEYTGQVKYTMVHPHTEPAPFVAKEESTDPGKICYYPNTDEHEGTMGCQTKDDSDGDIASGSSVTLLASNYSRDGYGFAGWNDKHDYSGTFYGPNETISAPSNIGEKGLSLYAVWVKSQGSLQDSTKVASVCSELDIAPTDGTANLSSVSALTDQRDNNTYAIAKLADNKCWMIENLRLEAENTRTAEKQALAQGYGTSATYGNFSGLANAESENFSDSTTANSIYYSGTQSGDATINIGTSNDPGCRIPRYNNWNNQSTSANRPQNPTTNDATNSTTNAGMYSYGNYYTWHAAIADTTYYSSGNHGTTSLCPTGWRLPIGDQSTANRSFGALSVALGGPTGGATAGYSSTPTGTVMSGVFRSFPNNFLYSGYLYDSSAYNLGSDGRYWSSAAYYSYYSYALGLSSSDVYPGTRSYNKNVGFSIRCVSSS